ncbi:L,D-transpeptidase family protein [Paracoccus sp. M683]|uniref:L,D-transpeptidase family protein n=1 Tax=Paracoccus sp. M683 TaxID=2594268 RepID=UPI00117E1819|nr:L,D-transpeptidase family protein [Paracoccus sp. M683]TRW99282.1 L,D-transpeptidase family protein [Paracoccus sp. M683]
MILTRRAAIALVGAAGVAACSKPKPSRFKTYDGPPVTQIVVKKGERRLHLISGKTVLKSYDIGLGNQPIGHKMFEGDGKTPEGAYFIDRFNPRSQYHLSVGISYPDQDDVARALTYARPPGGDIFIHGRGPEGNVKAPKLRDWTAGCIAVTDEEIEEIYAMLTTGVPVFIYP